MIIAITALMCDHPRCNATWQPPMDHRGTPQKALFEAQDDGWNAAYHADPTRDLCPAHAPKDQT